MKSLKPKVSLIDHTHCPIAVMAYARRIMHSNVPDSLYDLLRQPKKYLGTSVYQYFEEVLLKDGMPTFLEYVHFVFKLENVSRSLQQQLTRHRIGFSFSIQSLRCVDLPKFAEKGNYTNPMPKNSPEYKKYHQLMLDVQKAYNKALKQGLPSQDARGLLPLNVHSSITFACNLRSLIDMVNKRLCLKTQDEFREVAEQIVKAVKKVEPRLVVYFNRPCVFGKCIMKAENELQIKENKFNGKCNTDHVCPIYIKLRSNK